MSPTPNLHVDCYLDANFAGLNGIKDSQDPIVLAVELATLSLLLASWWYGVLICQQKLYCPQWRLSIWHSVPARILFQWEVPSGN